MKCPSCGADMPEGSLYCEKCGKDIHIVPDFEAELEDNMMKSLEHIAETVKNGIFPKKNMDEDLPGNSMEKRRSKKRTMVLGVLSVVVCFLLAAVVTGGILLFRHFSYAYQMENGAICYEKGRYDAAVVYYKRAVELEPASIETYFLLADSYMQMGNKIEYEYLLRELIRNPLCTLEHVESAYGKLIAIYRERGEYEVINQILQACGLQSVRNTYQSYLASPPIFSYEEGTYDKVIPLKLTTDTVGSIYYTLDGSEPDAGSSLYTAPILLENGTTVVTAVVINEYGIVSEKITKEYIIEVEIEEEPVVSVVSGTYYMPMLIEVMEEGKQVYYTTDGSTPNLHSNLYTGPISMPLGISEYCFAFLEEDGTCSQVARCRYELVIQTEISPEDAHGLVVNTMIQSGRIYHAEGYFSITSAAKYIYEYLYVIRLENAGDYYVFAEVFRDEKNVQNRTGTYYAVSIHTMECCKLITDENNNYSLVEILIDP